MSDGTWKEIERIEKPIKDDSFEDCQELPSDTNIKEKAPDAENINGKAINGAAETKPENSLNGTTTETANNNTSDEMKVPFAHLLIHYCVSYEFITCKELH